MSLAPLSPTQLSAFFECRHHSWLELGVARGELQRPGQNALERLLLEQRGRAHEQRVLAHYQNQGLQVVRLSPAPARDADAKLAAARATLAAMQAGADVIHQATLLEGAWTARPDFLRKAPGESRFGQYRYEVVDAKLARHAQARAIIQLCAYTDQLERLQGALPEHFWIAVGGSEPKAPDNSEPRANEEALGPAEPLAFRCQDYLAYYRRSRLAFEGFVASGTPAEPYPEPVDYCNVCLYWKRCEERRCKDDHLSLVAGISRRQRDRLSEASVPTTTALGALAPDRRITGIEIAPLGRIREQARLQVLGRSAPRPLYELLFDVDPGAGLEKLPEPTPGDLFLDLEGDAYALGSGLEYLFGLLELGEPSDGWSRRTAPGAPRYTAHWAATRAEEKLAFTEVMKRIQRGRLEFPKLHVYHFGHRESDALKKLSCRHGTLEDAVDELLRQHVLVDLHSVVRQGVRVSVEHYTLKHLESVYGFERKADRRAAAEAMQLYGYYLETQDPGVDLASLRARITGYNEDDCVSAWRMRDWLEGLRKEFESSGGGRLARPSSEASAEVKDRRNSEATAIAERLRAGLPEDEAKDSPTERAQRVLSQLVHWHWRELKSAYWEYFHAKELPPSERVADRLVLDGLVYERDLGVLKKSIVRRYRFPEQEHGIRASRSQKCEDPDTGKQVSVVEIGPAYIDIKRGKTSQEPHPRSLIRGTPPDPKAQEASLLAIARSVAHDGLDATGKDLAGLEFSSARALLSRTPPATGQAPGAPLLEPGEDTVAGVVRLALSLERGVLGVQGPPGAGKTHRAAHAIVALLRAGKRVGVTANSHHVITSLLRKALELAQSQGLTVDAQHLDDSDEQVTDLPFAVGKDYAAVGQQLLEHRLQLVGGTSYAWPRPELRGTLDVLIVDEAAQLSLANVLAASPAAQSLILFGDPAQLEQPQRGVHPPGAGVSALEYLIGAERATMPDWLGVFLPETRRLHPKLCAFTSRAFYEGRLDSWPATAEQRLLGAGEFSGSGLSFVPVVHRGNTNRSDEEVAVVRSLVQRLLSSGAQYRDAEGSVRPLQPRDMLVVAPYNAQVAALQQALEPGVPVGTVDKFQGQEAPIVIYSMASSSSSEAPRGVEFLYSTNRLNVATSRAQARVILVASPELASAQCRTPEQMRLVNALCAYLELSETAAESR